MDSAPTHGLCHAAAEQIDAQVCGTYAGLKGKHAERIQPSRAVLASVPAREPGKRHGSLTAETNLIPPQNVGLLSNVTILE